MRQLVRTTDPDKWIAEIFAAKPVTDSGVIRRHRGWIDRKIGRRRFEADVRKRGFHLLETADQ
ncbi:MAG: N-(5'-phosphoribosyl)anthranilate isomerase, partial [Paracoccaceae bacterium]